MSPEYFSCHLPCLLQPKTRFLSQDDIFIKNKKLVSHFGWSNTGFALMSGCTKYRKELLTWQTIFETNFKYIKENVPSKNENTKEIYHQTI